MTFSFIRLAVRITLLFGLAFSSHAQTKPDAMGAPNEFVQQVADQVLAALKSDAAVKAGDTARINQIVDELILPYVILKRQRASQPVVTGAMPRPSKKPHSSKRFAEHWRAPTAGPSPVSMQVPQ